jgi:hypothetical protein
MRKLVATAALGLFFVKTSGVVAAPHPMPMRASDPPEVQFGQSYQLRDSVAFTLKSAKYTVERVNIGAASYFPQAGEKLLVLHFRVQNVTKDTMSFDAGTIPFSVVDAAGVVHKSVQDVGLESSHATAEFDLKPGEVQDDLYTVLTTPAAGADTALVVEAGREGVDEDSLRFPLAGKVSPLPAIFASPDDRSGVSALKSVSGAAGTFYPLALLNARLDSTAYTDQSLGGTLPEEGQRYFTAIFTIQNKSAGMHGISGMNFVPTLRDVDGHIAEYNQTVLKPLIDATGDTVLKQDAEATVRFFWTLPKAAHALSLSLAEGQSRAYVFDVSGPKL